MSRNVSTRALVVAKRNRATNLGLEVFSARCGLHPDLILRFVNLGLIEPAEGRGRDLWFAPTEIGRVERMERLRTDFSLNYAALGLVLDLLDRIDELERNARHQTHIQD